MDTIARSTPTRLRFSTEEKEFFHADDGSFGADDKAGLLVQLEALRHLKENWWDKGVEHRKVMFVITAQEENGFRGAKYLVDSHPELFKNSLFSLTSDGPIDLPHYNPDTSFVVVVPRAAEKTEPYASLISVVGDMAKKKGRKLELTELGLGMGDFEYFNKVTKSDLHIRAPYEGNHSEEKVNVRNLIDHIDLWVYLLEHFADHQVPFNQTIDQAMSHTTQIISKTSLAEKGGIDLDKILIKRTGHVIKTQFDPAQTKILEQNGFEGFTPVVTNIIRIDDPARLLGIVVNPRILAKEIRLDHKYQTI